MTTTSPISHRLWILLGALLIAALLAAACSSNDAVDVTPAKPDDDSSTLTEPDGEDQPSDETINGEADDPGDAGAPAETEPSEPDDGEPVDGEPDEVAPTDSAPSSVNGWTRLSPAADLLHVETTPHGPAIVAGGRGEGLLSVDGGATWRRIDWPGDVRSQAFVDPSGEAISVAGFSSASGLEGAAYRSEDGGVTWGVVLLNTPVLSWYVLDSFLHGVPGFGVYASNDALDTGTLLATASDAWPDSFDPVRITADPGNLDVFAVTSVSEGGVASVRLTRDSGASFTELAPEFELWGVTIPIFSGIGPLIMSQGVGLLFSFDQGATWFTQNQGLEELGTGGLFTELVDFVSPPQRSLPVIATGDSIFSFNPGGWNEMAGPGAEIRALAVREAGAGGSEELLLAATDQGVWSIPTADLAAN